jgi:hypothetical protein
MDGWPKNPNGTEKIILVLIAFVDYILRLFGKIVLELVVLYPNVRLEPH